VQMEGLSRTAVEKALTRKGAVARGKRRKVVEETLQREYIGSYCMIPISRWMYRPFSSDSFFLSLKIQFGFSNLWRLTLSTHNYVVVTFPT